MLSRLFARTLRLGLSSVSRRSNSANPNSRQRFRPVLETLETRALLTAGDLDPTFGSGGVVMDDLSPANDAAIDLIVQSSGKMVVGGYKADSQGRLDSVLRRYQADGSLDISFGTNGMTVTDFKGGWNDTGLALAVQPDGKIIGVANSYDPRDFSFPYDARWGLARYTANGALDQSFGTKGKVVADFGKGTDIVSGVALQADGKIVVSGTTHSSGFAGGENFFVARYHGSGSVDTSFGGGKGYVVTDFGGVDQSAELAIQGDGKIIVVGGASGGSLGYPTRFALARYMTGGSLDPTFGSGGKILTSFSDVNGPVEGRAKDVLLQADGRIVVGGTNFIARYMHDGSLDPSFGNAGATTVLGQGDSLAAQADGKLVLGGYDVFYEDLGDGVNRFSTRFMLTRISGADGSIDTSFDNSGQVFTYLTEPGKRAGNSLSAIAIQADGRIVGAGATGVYSDTGSMNPKFTLVRYLGDNPQPAGGSSTLRDSDAAWLLFMDDFDAAKRRRK